MRVLLFTEHYLTEEVGGAQKSVQFLAEGLKRKGVDVAVCAVHDAPKMEITEHQGVRIYKVPLLGHYKVLRDKYLGRARALPAHLQEAFWASIPPEVEEVFAREKPALVHTNILGGFSVYLWKICRRHGARIVHTTRDFYLLCARAIKFKNGQPCTTICRECKFLSWPKKNQTRYVDAVVGISQMILAEHLQDGYFPQAKYAVVIPNSVENAGRANLPVTGARTPVRLGFIGRLLAAKGIELLLREFALLPAGAFTLLIAGVCEPRYLEQLKAAAGENVVFLGRVDSDEFYPMIDLLIAPSLWDEPFGRVVPEAYSFGVPVLGSRRGALPELIETGVTGDIFDPEQPGDLNEKIRQIFRDPGAYLQMRQAAARAARRFEDSAVTDAYFALYQDVLGEATIEPSGVERAIA